MNTRKNKIVSLLVVLTVTISVLFSGCGGSANNDSANQETTTTSDVTPTEKPKASEVPTSTEEPKATETPIATEEPTPTEETKVVVDDSAIPEKAGKALGAYTEDEKALIAKEFKAAYKAALESGFNPGECADGLAHDWDGVVAQNFINGDSSSQAWGLKNLAIIEMNLKGDKKAYLIKNEFVDGYQRVGAPAACGAPTSNQYEKDSVLQQDFEKGTMVLKNRNIKWVAK